MTDPVSAWLASQGVDVLAAMEALAMVILIAMLWGLALALAGRG